jgi:hypothetical protein
MENRIAFSLTEAEKTQLLQHLQAIVQIIQPKSVVLSAEDISGLPKMADSNLPFTEKAIGYMATASQFKPDFVNTSDAEIDLEAYKISKQFLIYALQVSKSIGDISLLSGSEAYLAALAYYRNVKFHADAKQPGAKEIYEELSKRFIGFRSKKA